MVEGGSYLQKKYLDCLASMQGFKLISGMLVLEKNSSILKICYLRLRDLKSLPSTSIIQHLWFKWILIKKCQWHESWVHRSSKRLALDSSYLINPEKIPMASLENFRGCLSSPTGTLKSNTVDITFGMQHIIPQLAALQYQRQPWEYSIDS